MEKEINMRGKKCFIITPIGDIASEMFRMAKGVIDTVIKPLLIQYGYDDVKPSYEINETGMITTQIINRIIDDDLVVANLTGNNPNVMYELCLRHIVAKPIVHICQEGTILPFDVKDNRTIFYRDDMLGVQELNGKMNLFLQEIDYNKEYIDNPIYIAQKVGKLLKEVSNENENNIEIDLLQNIFDILSKLQNDSRRLNPQWETIKLEILGTTENRRLAISEMTEKLRPFGIRIGKIIYYENSIFMYSEYFNFNMIGGAFNVLKKIEEKYNVSIEWLEGGII